MLTIFALAPRNALASLRLFAKKLHENWLTEQIICRGSI